MEALQYPIGRFNWDGDTSVEARARRIAVLAACPADLRAATAGLSNEQLDTAYRPGGWTLRQVVHHLGDSHINSFCRFRFALTEDRPAILVYDEVKWAELPDSVGPIGSTLTLLEGLHERWVTLLGGMSDGDYGRTFLHRDAGETSLNTALALYAWHCAHHLRHITMTRESQGW